MHTSQIPTSGTLLSWHESLGRAGKCFNTRNPGCRGAGSRISNRREQTWKYVFTACKNRALGLNIGLLESAKVRTALYDYRANWEPAASSGRRALGVFWRCPAVLWGLSTPTPTQVSWKTLILKNWPIFPASCGYVVVLPHVAQVRFWRPKRPHSE